MPATEPVVGRAPCPDIREGLDVVVAQVRRLTDRIQSFMFRHPDGGDLPAFSPGSHIEVEVTQRDGTHSRRSYSLVSDPKDRRAYEIAVLAEANGSGGSQYMHDRVVEGSRLRIWAPTNHFELDTRASKHLLIAGGIGITPLMCMARWIRGRDQGIELHYCARTEQAMAYREEVSRIAPASTHLYFDGGDSKRGVNLEALLSKHQPGTAVYVCGPQPLILAVIETCQRNGWPKEAVHYEFFAPPVVAAGSKKEFEVVLKRSNRTLRVPAEKTILDVLFDAGESPLHGCKTGDCGLCETGVVEGVPLHLDRVLSENEKQKGNVMCICVSRSETPKLVLDI